MWLDGKNITVESTYHVAMHAGTNLQLAQEAQEKMQASHDNLIQRLANQEVVYGVNTGFGALSSKRVAPKDQKKLQRRLLLSHCTGVGPSFSIPETRAMLYLRANALATGHSGVRVAVVEKILEFLAKDIVPIVPQKGSVGASGDLAPLAHLALPLIGIGWVWQQTKPVCHITYGETYKQETQEVLKQKGVEPLELGFKEGLSLINGCQASTAVGLLLVRFAEKLWSLAHLAGAMSLEALKGSHRAFHPLISQQRPHAGEKRSARLLRRFLGEGMSSIQKSHANCEKVQDAYSLRCMPAVHGAAWEALNQARKVLEIEANSSTDNPLVFSEQNEVLSCGNFHGAPVALMLDTLAVAFASVANISERRIARLMDPQTSELPAFLIADSGLNSGFMMAHVTASALASENKGLAHPASVDSIPTSAGKEDHVSMSTQAACKLKELLQNTETILATELLCAAQGLDFLRPLKSSPLIEQAHHFIREHIAFAKEDRLFGEDMHKMQSLLESLFQSIERDSK